MVRWHGQANGLGAGWLNCLPGGPRAQWFSREHFQAAMKFWLGVPVLPPAWLNRACPDCGQPLDLAGDHFLCCPKAGFLARHRDIQDYLGESLSAVKQTFSKEAELQRWNGSRRTAPALRPADLLLPAWSEGRPLAVDITVAHSCQLTEAPFHPCKGDVLHAQARRTQSEKVP